jgi:hypothetical protein
MGGHRLELFRGIASGRCWPWDGLACAKWTVGRPSPQSLLISQLTLPPKAITHVTQEYDIPNSNRTPDGTPTNFGVGLSR